MFSGELERLFERAARTYGPDYVEARDAILTQAEDQREALIRGLEELGSSAASWEDRLTLAILRGWLEQSARFEKCVQYLREPLPGPRPLTGFTPAVRGQTIAALGPPITPRVLELLYKSREFTSDGEAAALFLALTYLKDSLAVEPMIAILQTNHSAAWQRGAIMVLSAVGESPGLDAILPLTVQTHPDATVRLAAISALASFGDARATESLLECVQASTRSAEEREAAGYALARRGDPRAREGALVLLRHEPSSAIQKPLALLLGRIGRTDDIALLEKLLSSSDQGVRAAAEDAIAEIRNRSQ